MIRGWMTSWKSWDIEKESRASQLTSDLQNQPAPEIYGHLGGQFFSTKKKKNKITSKFHGGWCRRHVLLMSLPWLHFFVKWSEKSQFRRPPPHPHPLPAFFISPNSYLLYYFLCIGYSRGELWNHRISFFIKLL